MDNCAPRAKHGIDPRAVNYTDTKTFIDTFSHSLALILFFNLDWFVQKSSFPPIIFNLIIIRGVHYIIVNPFEYICRVETGVESMEGELTLSQFEVKTEAFL